MRLDGSILLVFAVLMTGSAQVVPAQARGTEVRVRLESTEGSSVSGALVALLDSAQRVVVEGVSGETGTRVLTAPPGSYRIRVRRIGFRPFLSEPVSVPVSDELLLRFDSRRVQLESVVVTSRSECGPIDPSEQTLATIWDEIAKALRSRQLSVRDLDGIANYYVYRKTMRASGRVVSSDTTFRKLGTSKPFGVRDPAILARDGYVFGNEATGWTYYAPDETVLLSEQFAATHCFRAVRDKDRSGQVGIEFNPVKGRSMPEIEGVLWVDQRTAELRELTFRFVNSGVLEKGRAGGFTRFRRVPSGAWIVDAWALKAPILERQHDVLTDKITILGYIEDGGGVTMRSSSSPSPPPSALGPTAPGR